MLAEGLMVPGVSRSTSSTVSSSEWVTTEVVPGTNIQSVARSGPPSMPVIGTASAFWSVRS